MIAAAHTHAAYRRHGVGRRVLPLFIIISAATHALMFATWQPAVPAAGGHGPITVTLRSESMPAAVPTEDALPGKLRPQPIAESKRVLKPVQRNTTAATKFEPAPTLRDGPDLAVEAMTTSSAPPDAYEAAAATTAIAARVNLELARHFHYPPQAVRRGWQGIVLLGLRVGVDGHIEAIHIAQSSGHALLDRAALGALGKVQKLALDGGMLRAALDLQLPVIYRLEES